MTDKEKPLTLFYYGSDGELAKELARRERESNPHRLAQVRNAVLYGSLRDRERAARVVVSHTVAPHLLDCLKTDYGSIVETPGGFAVTLPELKTIPDLEPLPPSKTITPGQNALPVFAEMTNREIREWAIDRGIDIKHATNKDQLIARIMAHATT